MTLPGPVPDPSPPFAPSGAPITYRITRPTGRPDGFDVHVEWRKDGKLILVATRLVRADAQGNAPTAADVETAMREWAKELVAEHYGPAPLEVDQTILDLVGSETEIDLADLQTEIRGGRA